MIACIASLYCGYLEETSGGSGEKGVGGQHCEKVCQLDGSSLVCLMLSELGSQEQRP